MSVIVRARSKVHTRAATNARAIQHSFVAEHAATGKARRPEVGRRVHGEWAPSLTCVPELVRILYGRMLVSPVTFFRGAAFVEAMSPRVMRDHDALAGAVASGRVHAETGL